MTAEPFTLTNDPPKPLRGDFPGRDKQQQKVLFTGLDLPPNTRELFDTSYAPAAELDSDAPEA